ncbi:LmeA family phospholipid-binding protein [Allonocardiopsis opalescens]|nr:DUF2993 domain-containing protein [Allonocardiopsis opalescens]
MRRFLGCLGIVLIVLVIGLGILDRVAHSAAQSELAGRIQSGFQLESEPAVAIAGFPFLTQAVSGTYDEIRVTMGEQTYEDVQVSSVDVYLREVQAPLSDLLTSGAASVVAGSAEGTVVVPYSEVQRRAPEGFEITPEGDLLRIDGQITALGMAVPVSATLALEVTEEGLQAVPQQVSVDSVPIEAVQDQLGFGMGFSTLPMGLQISDAVVRDEGIAITATGQDIPLSQTPQ